MQVEINLLNVALFERGGVKRIDFFEKSSLGGDLEIWQIRRWVRLKTYFGVFSCGLFLEEFI
jgi:hypothetical protein